MKGRQIMGMFLMESATLGALGILLGVGLGSLAAYYLVNVGISLGDLDMSDVAGAGSGFALGNTLYGTYIWGDTLVLSAVCLVIILVASLYPAWFATRKEPIDALRAF
jgi:ABC-type lipoprotein release transport system permease subunit